LCLHRVGTALRSLNRFEEAEATLSRALERFVELGNVHEELEVRGALGTLYNLFWRPESSIPVLERAVELLPEREASIHGWVLLSLGLGYRFAGRRAESAELTARAFGIAERLGDDYLLGYCYQERGWSAIWDGNLADAERDFRQMLAIFERIRQGSGAAGAREGLGQIAVEQGRYDDALAEFDAGIAHYDRLGDRVRAGEMRLQRSAALNALGRRTEAIRERVRAEALIGDAPVRRDPSLDARLPVLPER